jgi:hypothetical protein
MVIFVFALTTTAIFGKIDDLGVGIFVIICGITEYAIETLIFASCIKYLSSK